MVTFIIILLIIGGIVYSSMSKDSKEVRERYKGRNDSQKNVIRYFMNDGCLQKRMEDEEYDALVQAYVETLNAKQKAMDKVGLDESELKEIDPVNFSGWKYGKDVSFSKRGKDGVYRSSAYQISWIFFSSTQVYLYQNTIHLDKDDKKEVTEEYFYKDITNFSTSADTVETPYWDVKQKKYLLENVDSNRFALTVPGDKFYCSLVQNDYTERAIQAMKAKLREKKSA